jgi:hypothetical protein
MHKNMPSIEYSSSSKTIKATLNYRNKNFRNQLFKLKPYLQAYNFKPCQHDDYYWVPDFSLWYRRQEGGVYRSSFWTVRYKICDKVDAMPNCVVMTLLLSREG